jgi:uncharacterized protein YndB with AHSA1/START domain
VPVANSETFSVRPEGQTDIIITRLFNAPPAVVFACMTTPEHIRRWWGNLGEGYSVSVCEMDARVGGKWRFINVHPQGEAEFYGEIREMDPPSRMVHTETYAAFPDAESVITTTFSIEAGKTRLTAVCRYPSAEVRDAVLASGMEHGAAISYDRLEEVAQAATA